MRRSSPRAVRRQLLFILSRADLVMPSHDRKLRFEQLEDRRLLAGNLELVKDINPLTGSSNPSNSIAIGTTLYFTANDGVSGVELWKSDGTAAGTVRVKDIRSGTSSSSPDLLTNVSGTLFLSRMTVRAAMRFGRATALLPGPSASRTSCWDQ